jgi:hypothetical protein
MLARSQYPEGPATGHLDTCFSWFPCVYKRMLRWFPSFPVATTCLSCSPPDLSFLVAYFIFVQLIIMIIIIIIISLHMTLHFVISFLIVGTFKSACMNLLVMYRGAFTVARRTLF